MTEAPAQDPRAVTAGEQDHSNPWKYAGDVADAPRNPRRSLRRTAAKVLKRALPTSAPSEPVLRGALPWRNCYASTALLAGVNAKWPNRDKTSDGTIGDAEHATRTSDHNPWVIVGSYGVVRARDIDKDGVDIAWLFEELRKLGAAGDPRLAGGGYLIYNRRITSPDFKTWRVYEGANPHTEHGHASFSLNQAGFDSKAGWSFFAPPVPPAPKVPAVTGEIKKAYDRPVIGNATWAFFLGAPKGTEVPTWDKVGRWQEFAKGAILWHPTADGGRAHVVWGSILKRFWALGAERVVGYPTTDELSTPDGVGRYNHFTGSGNWPASIYWSPKTGAKLVKGMVREAWAKANWEKGLGYPLDEEHEAEGGLVQNFERGSILFKDGQAVVRTAK